MPVVQCPIEGFSYQTPDHGDAIVAALITAHCTSHNTNPGNAAKLEKVKRPIISSAGTSEEWSYFMSRWRDYVDATKVSGKDRVIHLLECCDEDLRKDLTRSAGCSLTSKSEDEVLTAMRKLAVREENIMVARVSLQNMKQDNDEPIRSFCARLKGQANICKFSVKCPTCSIDISYTDAMIKDTLTKVISDSEIQLDLLAVVSM